MDSCEFVKMPLFHIPANNIVAFWGTAKSVPPHVAALRSRRPMAHNPIVTEFKDVASPTPIELKFADTNTNETVTVYVPDWFQGVRSALKD